MTTPAPPDQIKHDLARAGIAVPLLAEEDVHRLPAMRGAYVLILNLVHEVHLDRPRQAARALSPGWYIYAGSARGAGGIRARLARHFREEKRNHWHIDQLTFAAGARIWASPAPESHECDLVAKLVRSKLFRTAFAGFGSTDCSQCEAHLLVWKTKQ
jgi:Uri superfamily endonuclease